MRRTKVSHWMCAALLSGALVSGCGGSSSNNKDAGKDGLVDVVIPVKLDAMPKLDTGKMDTGKLDTGLLPDSASGNLDGLPQDTSPRLDTVTTDVPPKLDVPLDVPATGGTVADGGIDAPATDTPVGTGGTGGTSLDASSTGGAIGPDAPSSPAVVSGWPVAAMDFGLNPCGGPAAAARTFTLTNAGASAVMIQTATFSTNAGYTSDAAGKAIPANGGTLVVTVTPPAVPATSVIPKAYNDTLALTTNIPGDVPHLVPVTQSAQGAILAWDTSVSTLFGSFGSLPPGQAADQAVRVLNTGNLDANIALITATPFSTGPTNPTLVTQGEAQDFTVTFTAPNAAGPTGATLGINLATNVALCQPLPAILPLTGSSINGAIAISKQSLVFYAQCGGTADPQTFTVTNTGTAAMTWSGAMTNVSSIFSLAPAGATLAMPTDAGTDSASTVTVSATGPGTSRTIVSDTLTISTNITGDTPHQMTVTQIPLGDDITITPSSAIDFGSVPITSPALQSAPTILTVTNNANANSDSAVVSLSLAGAGAAYFQLTPSTVTIAAGATAEVSLVFAPGSDTGIVTSGSYVDLAATLEWEVGSEANCGAASGSRNLTGRATLALVDVSPSALDFGLVNCGTQAPPKQITLTNPGSAAYNIVSLALSNPAAFTLTGPDLPVAVTPGNPVVLTLTPTAIPAEVETVPNTGAWSGALIITTDAINDTPHNVPLEMGAKGVIISGGLSTATWTFGTPIDVGDTGQFQVYIRNDGNATATATLQNIVKGTGELDVFSLTNPTVIAANATDAIVALFQPYVANKTWNTTGTLVVAPSSNEVFCKPLPASYVNATITLTGLSSSAAAP